MLVGCVGVGVGSGVWGEVVEARAQKSRLAAGGCRVGGGVGGDYLVSGVWMEAVEGPEGDHVEVVCSRPVRWVGILPLKYSEIFR